MTLILNYISHYCAVSASDRLVTVGKKEHDPTANKIIVGKLDRCFLIIGYTGLAYIKGIPSDELLMRCISPRDDPIDSIMLNCANTPRNLNQIVGNIVKGLRSFLTQDSLFRANFLQIGISGLVSERKIVQPYGLVITKQKNSEVFQFQKAIRHPNKNYRKKAIWISGGWPLSRPDLFRDLILKIMKLSPEDSNTPELVADHFKENIRHCAKAIPGIGDEVMLVTHAPFWGAGSVELFSTKAHETYSGLEEILGEYDIQYTPWIFGANCIFPPLRLIGDTVAEIGGYQIKMRGGRSSNNLFVLTRQERKDEPGPAR